MEGVLWKWTNYWNGKNAPLEFFANISVNILTI